MTPPTTLLQALQRPGFLVSAWPWRAMVYAATTATASVALWLLLCVPLAPLTLAVDVLRYHRVSPGGATRSRRPRSA